MIKQLKTLLLLHILFLSNIAFSQNYQTIEEVDDACSQLGFKSDEDAEIAVDQILDQIGLFRNFTIQQCPNINNAVAKNIEISPGQKERYILYDANFFDRIDDKANNRWAAISVLAHEIGHHLNGHSLNNEGSNHKFELEADYFSGLALAKMGATKAEAQSAIMTITYEKATRTHPAKANRLLSIEKGWNKANGITTKKTVKEENEDIAFNLYRKGEKAFELYNISEAIDYFNKAKDLNYKDAYYYLSHIYYTGIGVNTDYDKAYQYAKQGYDLGSIPATYQLGKYLANGTGVLENKEEANRLFQKEFQIKWFKDQYSKYKTPFHAYAIGYMYSEGFGGVKKDEEIAILWYKQAAEGGSLTGMGNLGVQYDNGEGINKSKTEAVKWYKKAAELGHPNSMTNLGSKYRTGEGVEKNIETCLYWYNKAIKKGSPEAIEKIASLYLKGEEIEQNTQLALTYYNMALKYNPKIYATIGNIYVRGTGIEKDKDKAFYYFKKGADLKEKTSISNIAYCYDEGVGTEINWVTAIKHYREAANLGSAYSLRNLGEFYYFGVGGLEQDKYKAISLFEKAANLDDEIAKSYLEIINQIKNKEYISVIDSNYGNRLFITDEIIEQEYAAYPFTFAKDKHNNSWSIKVNYKLGSNTQAVRIFPTNKNNNNNNNIEFKYGLYYTNYSPSSTYYEPTGSHKVGTSIKNIDAGYRAIKYVYYKGTFYNNAGTTQEEVVIKAPVALCWQPR